MSALLKKLVFLVFLLPFALFLQAQEIKNLDIYLAIGQSNMAGRAEILHDLTAPIEDVYLFTGQEWVPATNPLNLYSSVRKVVSMQRLGPAYGFARKMQRDIAHLITALRDSLNLPDLPFVVGQLSEDKAIRKPLNAFLTELPKQTPNTGVALAYGTTTFDSTHFDSPSQLLIGERYATEMINLLKTQTQTDDFSFGILTDIQYADVETVGKRNYRGTLETLKRTIPFLNAYDLEFSFHLGDLIDRDFESFNAPLSILESSKAPFHYIWGNHDFSVLDSLKQKVGGKIANEKGYYSIEKGNMVFMVVNGMDISVGAHPEGTKNHVQALEMMTAMETEGANNVKPWNGAVGEEQLAWMESVVQKAEKEGKHVIALCHYPLLPENGLHLLNHKEVMNRIGKSPAMVAWFSGHHHAGNYFKDSNGMHHLTFLGMVEAESPALGAIVTVKKDYLIIQGIGKEEDRILNFR